MAPPCGAFLCREVDLRKIHHHAMDLVRKADDMMKNNENSKALRFYAAASRIEEFVAARLENTEKSEPARSILYLSAASLAWRSGNDEKAKRLITDGLSGSPSPGIKADLKQLNSILVS